MKLFEDCSDKIVGKLQFLFSIVSHEEFFPQKKKLEKMADSYWIKVTFYMLSGRSAGTREDSFDEATFNGVDYTTVRKV